ncbi:hypothetical protein, partial [Amycolatopsis vancoresmycina]
PAGWPVARELTLPVADPARGVACPMPEPPEPAPAGLDEAPGADQAASWEVVEDLLHDTVSLRLAGGNRIRPDTVPGGRHTLEVEQELVATAHRLDPGASTTTGRLTGTVDTATGAHLTVEVTVTATATTLDAHAKVVQDGASLLDRHWRG